jgi:hypothetical protein
VRRPSIDTLIRRFQRIAIIGMVEWTPVFVLPNVKLAEAIEGELAILAPAHDPRVEAVGQAHETFRSFLDRFTDAFGVTLAPTVLLLRSDAPAAFFHIDALASFRDLIALAVIGYSRALELAFPRGHRVFYGDAFDFYPWMVTNDYEYLICKTPAAGGIHEVGSFQGQSSPKLFQSRLERHTEVGGRARQGLGAR